MSITTISYSSCHLSFHPCCRCKSHVLFLSSYGLPTINRRFPIWADQGSNVFNLRRQFNAQHKVTREQRESDNSHPEAPVPAKPTSPAWKKWMVGIVLSIILPSFRHKWGPLQVLKSKADKAIETMESVTEIVEELAEEAEKVADEVESKLPEDTKLREAVESVENLAKEAVKEAKHAQELIQKVEEVEKEIEKHVMGPDTDQKRLVTPKP